ncbi:MAG: DUF2927 domain-containing protein [Alphaproteobacteria bacterium]|nr:hypothetical protein [Rhodospirillaceae bacterium]MDP6405823.1 DUF2927 domain-containing protein [Alphaproteobacteria bacterium]MDP6623470.1 DUF2927 domain-containing protein [Alphaproteobacteria bacterium]
MKPKTLLALLLPLAFMSGTAQARPSVDKLVEYFSIIAFGSEIDGVAAHQSVRKWQGPIRYKLAGLTKDAKTFRPIIQRHTKALTRYSRIEFKEVPGKAPGEELIIWFSKPDGMLKAARLLEKNERVIRRLAQERTCFFLTYHLPPGRLVKSMIVINVEREFALTEHCLLEELSQSLGLPNDSPLVTPSIFNTRDRLTKLSFIDKVLIRTLYDPRLKAGTPKKLALRQVRAIIKELARGK